MKELTDEEKQELHDKMQEARYLSCDIGEAIEIIEKINFSYANRDKIVKILSDAQSDAVAESDEAYKKLFNPSHPQS
jgi:hypothetical protein